MTCAEPYLSMRKTAPIALAGRGGGGVDVVLEREVRAALTASTELRRSQAVGRPPHKSSNIA